MNKNMNKAAQGGFTLIELIVVIVILGILAATALPKFANLGGDARAASVRAASGALNSASSLAHGQFLIKPANYNSTTKTLTVEGVALVMNDTSGYPIASSNVASAAGLSSSDYNIDVVATAGSTAGTVTVSPKGVADKTKCNAVYTEPLTSNSAPTIAVEVSDCN